MLNTINYDEIDEQYGITPVIKEAKSINNLALSNVQTVPNELEQEYNEVYSAPDWFENLNVCSEDEIKEWQAMGPMGIAEAWERNNKWASFVPYINTTKDAAEAVNVSVLLKRLKDGKDLTEKQTDVLVDYLRDVKEQQVRGYSFAGGVVNAALTSIPYMEEFGIGLAASAEGVGLASLAKTLTTIGAKKAAKKAVQKAMQEATMKSTMTGVKKNLTKQEIKKIYDDAIIKTSTAKALGEVGGKRFATETAKALPKALTSSAKLSLTKMPQNFVGNIADRQISSGIYITDAGQGIFTNSENLALSTMKALGDSTFEALTETSGFLFAPINRYFAKPIRNVLPKKFYTAFDKLVSTRYGMKTTEALKKYGYDGILEEMGEEQLNRFLTDVFGSNGVQGYTLDGFLNNVFYFDREGKKGVEGLKTGLKNVAKGYATEALSFALAGAGARGAVGSVSKISDRWNQKKLNDQYKKLANYSLNEFYLDQGFIKIKGSQSSAELALRHRAEAMGIDKSTIDEYCQLSSENEIRAKLQELILNENATIDTEKTKVEKQAVEELKNTYFNQLKNTGVDEVVANQTADLYAYSFAKLAKDNGISIKDIPEANIDFRKLTPEQAVEQFKQGFKDNTSVKFQQSDVAGVEKTSDVEAAKKEWKEKGTDSKYFKKWFGDSKVVDEDGKPLVVYHGTEYDFDEFEANNASTDYDFPSGMYFSSSRNIAKTYTSPKPDIVMPLYLKIENPLVLDANGKNYNDFYDELYSVVRGMNKDVYDGIIINNIRDNWSQNDDGGEVATTYVMFNPEQIKSVDNQGTFDETNPNIYYQAMISGINPKQKVDVIDLTNNFSTDKNLSKKELSTRIKTLIGTKLTNKDKKAIIEFVKKSKRVGKKDVYVPDHIAGSSKVELNNKGERNTFVNNLTNLITNSVLIDKEPNKDKTIKPNVDNYLRFYVPVKINNDVFTVRITAENNTSKNLFNILNADVYDVIVDKKIQASSPSTKGNLMKPVSNNIISLSQQNSSVKQITIEEMLKDVKAPNGTVYFQAAYHGSAKDFDNFDLSYALSGEGAMAHGYGVYTAKNKDVSEEYRKTLAQSLKNAKYDGVPLSKTELTKLHYAISEKLYLKGKDEALKELELLRKQSEKNKDKEGFLGRSSREFLENYNGQLELLNSVDESKITGVNKGQLFEVDIPEDDVLLDEDLPLNEQPEKVKKAIFNYMKDNTDIYNMSVIKNYNEFPESSDGKWFYKEVAFNERLKGANDTGKKEASLLLNKYGIKGIKYDGRQDGECVVVFDDKAVEIIQKFYQEEYGDDSNIADTEKGIMNAKGFFYEKTLFDGTLKDNIMVLIDQKADASTLVHEFGHIYLQALNRLAKTSPRAKEQLLTVNKWLRFDGNEYTEAQHEKFANGFVAYVKSGKAPSYGLKRVFENFRRWLSDIYNNFITSETVELDEETQKVFDELLGDLSVNQQEKLSEEIIQKARDNASLRMRDEEIEKGKVKFNELTDKQRRYRDTAYEIVYYALKHSKNEETRNYVQNISDLRMKLGDGKTKSLQRQFERLELLLAETEDAFSANDGFLPEWGEFFTDPGVSYDNSESGADAELALEALSVITDKKYLTDETYEELSDEDVRRAEYEFEYIINEYRNAKDKSIPMVAFYEWLEGVVHPYLVNTYAEKWENKTNEIDRYQAMSKFEQAKEDLKLKAAQMQGLGDYSSQFAEYAREIIKRLDFMTEKDKVKIFDKLKDFNSFREIQKNLDDVMDFAQTLYNVTERRKIADDIIKEVDRTIHEWKDGIKRTKYTYPANKLFTRLRTLNNMRIEDIKDLYDAQVNEEIKPTYEADAVHDENYYETIEKMFIEFKANGVYYNSTEFLQDLLNRIQTAKYTAKVARDEIDFERKMQAVNLIDEAAKAVSKHTGKVSKLEKAYRYGFNLDSALEMMFNKNIKQKFSLDYLYAQKDAKVGADRDEVLKKLKENFGYKGAISDTLLFNRFIDMTKKEFDIYQRYTPDIEQGVIRDTHRDKETGKTVIDKTHKHNLDLAQWAPEKIKLSRMEALYYYIQSLNDESYKILTDDEKGQFDRFEFDSMINKLTDQEKMMGIILQQAAEKYYDDLNRYHIRKYHTELGKVKNYFPRKTEMTEVKPLELFNDYVNYSGVISAQKQRTAYKGARIAPANPVAVLFDHIEKANTLIIMGEQLDLMNRIFKEQNLKKKIEAVWGIDTAREFYNQIAGNLYSGQASMISEAERNIGTISNNVIKAQIFAKAQVGLKQIISFMNYGTGDEYVSTKEWTEEFLKQSANIKEWKKSVDYMMNIPYLKDRFGRGGSTDALKRQLEQKMFAKISLLDDFFSLPIKVGDVGAIVMGGKPYIDVLLKKGYTEEQALKIFIEKTVNEMQSSIPSTLSNMQRNAAKQPLTKMIFAYQNTPWQYFRVASNAIIRWKQNPNQYTGLNMVKLVGLYMYVFPLIFNLASSLSPITGDEEELKSDLWKSIIGGVTFVPIAYQFINAMLSGILGERVSSGNWFDTAAVKTGNLARKISKGEEITPLDVIKTISLFGEAATGLPLVSLETEATGVADIATGKPVKGFAKVAGYSDYRSRKIAGEE